MKLSKITKVLSLALAVTAVILVSGTSFETNAQQRDPFKKPSYAKPQKPRTNNTRTNTSPARNSTPRKPVKKVPKGPYVVQAPTIEARIDYYKRIRQEAAINGQPLPKVTSVLLVNEMTVSGVFKTPRGYAAIVEATPIKLSYTIYPGEKFFDGQLVAVEENRLVFRRVTKWSNNKFVSSVENKPLRKFTLQQEIQGTTPANQYKEEGKTQAAENRKPNPDGTVPSSGVIVSPLEEMNSQPADGEKGSANSNEPRRSKKGKKRSSNRKKRS